MACVVQSKGKRHMYQRMILVGASFGLTAMPFPLSLRGDCGFAANRCPAASLLRGRLRCAGAVWSHAQAATAGGGACRRWGSGPAAVAPTGQPGDADYTANGDTAMDNEEEGEEDQDAAMAAYEEFLLRMDEASSASMPGLVAALAEGGAAEVTTTEAVKAIVNEAVALLPEDGRSLRLTDLTPLLDVEAVNELSGGGSVLSFLQSFPDVFTLTASENQEVLGGGLGVGRVRRWYVSRSKPTKSPAAATLPAGDGGCAPAMKPDDLVDLYAEEELRALIRPTSCGGTSVCEKGRLNAFAASSRPAKCRRQHALQPVSDAAGGHASISAPNWSLLAAALPPSKPLPVPQILREVAPEGFVQQVKSSGKGLIRLFHEQYEVARHHVVLSAENGLIARAGDLHDAAAWTPSSTIVQLEKVDGPDESSWVGDLILDEEEEAESSSSDSFVEDEEDVAAETGQCGAAWAATAEPWPSVFYGGLSVDQKKYSVTKNTNISKKQKQLAQSKASAIRLPKLAESPVDAAKLVSNPDKADSGLKERKRAATPRSSSEGRPKNPEELQKVHTELALQRGWRTPLEMLDFFVECIPTFFVPIPELVPTDALARILGPRNTISHVVKVYSYFFEHDKDPNRVRLAPSLRHPCVGQANVHYTKWDSLHQSEADDPTHRTVSQPPARPCGLTLQSSATTNAFPILKPIIRSGRSTPNLNSSVTKNKHSINTARENPAASPSTLHGASRSSIFSGVESAEQPQSLRTLLRVINTVPYEGFVSFDKAAEQAGVTTAELETVIQGNDAFFLRASTHHHLFLTAPLPDGGAGRMVRLRPYWLAPNSLGELQAKDLPVEVAEALRPTWTPIHRLLSKISEESRDQLLQRMVSTQIDNRSINGGEKEGRNHLGLIVRYLRLVGRCCWVDADGVRVRRYTANADLDDFAHISVDLLSHFASHILEPIDVVLNRADATLSVLSHTTEEMAGKESSVTALCHHAMQSRRHEFVSFLQSHKRVLEIKAAGNDDPVYVRRKTSFVSFAPKT